MGNGGGEEVGIITDESSSVGAAMDPCAVEVDIHCCAVVSKRCFDDGDNITALLEVVGLDGYEVLPSVVLDEAAFGFSLTLKGITW
jgi:hypothetical protein